MSNDIEQKDRIQILLTEYTSLRSELNARYSSGFVAIGWVTIAAVWLLGQLTQPKLGCAFWIGLVILLVGALWSLRAIVFDVFNAARRVQEIEREVNDRAGERLLMWETERGGLTAHYWRRFFFPFG
jgi:hypothetical protein